VSKSPRSFALVAAVLFATASFGQSTSTQPIQATVCEILAQPKMFHGKRIRTRATVKANVADPNKSVLTDNHCDGELPLAMYAYATGSRSYRRLVGYQRQGVPVEATSIGQFDAVYGKEYIGGFVMQSVSNVIPKRPNR
jgi:hypothetical protein